MHILTLTGSLRVNTLGFVNCQQNIGKYILQNKRGLDTKFSYFLAFF